MLSDYRKLTVFYCHKEQLNLYYLVMDLFKTFKIRICMCPVISRQLLDTDFPWNLTMRFTDSSLLNTLLRAQIGFRCRRFGLNTVVGVAFIEILREVRTFRAAVFRRQQLSIV